MEVHLSRRADKFLEKLDGPVRKRILEKLKKLADEPVPSNAKFITRDHKNDKVFRYRIGKYRALYKVKNNEETVLITKIDKRPRIYRR